jgi:hypothetical protein
MAFACRPSLACIGMSVAIVSLMFYCNAFARYLMCTDRDALIDMYTHRATELQRPTNLAEFIAWHFVNDTEVDEHRNVRRHIEVDLCSVMYAPEKVVFVWLTLFDLLTVRRKYELPTRQPQAPAPFNDEPFLRCPSPVPVNCSSACPLKTPPAKKTHGWLCEDFGEELIFWVVFFIVYLLPFPFQWWLRKLRVKCHYWFNVNNELLPSSSDERYYVGTYRLDGDSLSGGVMEWSHLFSELRMTIADCYSSRQVVVLKSSGSLLSERLETGVCYKPVVTVSEVDYVLLNVTDQSDSTLSGRFTLIQSLGNTMSGTFALTRVAQENVPERFLLIP